MMTAHIVAPALNGGSNELPATLAPRILRDLLRKKMRFNGVIVSDALDMHAMEQGPGYVAETMAAGRAMEALRAEVLRAESTDDTDGGPASAPEGGGVATASTPGSPAAARRRR